MVYLTINVRSLLDTCLFLENISGTIFYWNISVTSVITKPCLYRMKMVMVAARAVSLMTVRLIVAVVWIIAVKKKEAMKKKAVKKAVTEKAKIAICGPQKLTPKWWWRQQTMAIAVICSKSKAVNSSRDSDG